MFRRGYMEVLFKTADTPLGLEFQAALTVFGVHLVAFSVADAEGAHRGLTEADSPCGRWCSFSVRWTP